MLSFAFSANAAGSPTVRGSRCASHSFLRLWMEESTEICARKSFVFGKLQGGFVRTATLRYSRCRSVLAVRHSSGVRTLAAVCLCGLLAARHLHGHSFGAPSAQLA